MPPCAGFLVFCQQLTHIILVADYNDVLSFPKGKIEKKKGDKDTLMGAYRELKEETGLTPDKIKCIGDGDVYVDEDSMKGNPGAIRLFLAELLDDKCLLKPEDTAEIKEVIKMPIDKALALLMPKRKKVLELGLELYRANL